MTSLVVSKITAPMTKEAMEVDMEVHPAEQEEDTAPLPPAARQPVATKVILAEAAMDKTTEAMEAHQTSAEAAAVEADHQEEVDLALDLEEEAAAVDSAVAVEVAAAAMEVAEAAKAEKEAAEAVDMEAQTESSPRIKSTSLDCPGICLRMTSPTFLDLSG
jgi:hypothetical protein